MKILSQYEMKSSVSVIEINKNIDSIHPFLWAAISNYEGRIPKEMWDSICH